MKQLNTFYNCTDILVQRQSTPKQQLTDNREICNSKHWRVKWRPV